MKDKPEYKFKLVSKVIHGQRVQVKVYDKQPTPAITATMYCSPVKRNTKSKG